MQAISFSFENSAVRTLGTPELPLFVATDIAKALGYAQPAKSVNDRVDPEDLVKAEIDTNGGVQTVNCVNESGLYALIFGSKLESAKRFKRWVTSEVLPAIRKTGRYDGQEVPEYLNPEQCWAIQSAVGKRARGQGAHFQTIYNALKAHFRVPKYTYILSRDFDEAIKFIQTCEIKLPVKEPAPAPQIEHKHHDGEQCPHCGLTPIAPDSIVLTAEEAQSLLTFIYYVRYLFGGTFDTMYKMLRVVNSPMAANLWDAFKEVNWSRMLNILAKHGHDINDMPCYKHWLAGRRAA